MLNDIFLLLINKYSNKPGVWYGGCLYNPETDN